MRALEPAHEDAQPRTLKIKPMAWLSQIRATDDDESWPLDLWQSFFCSTIGLPLPIVAAQSSTRCGCGRWYLDQYGDHAKTCKHHTGATKAHDWACERLATCLRSTGTKVKTQGAVTAVDGNKRGDLELMGYLGDGAQDLVLDFSMRHYRGGAAPRNWHRNGELLHPGRPDKDLDEKAASKIAKYRELYRDHRRQLDFLPAIASTSGRIHSELLRLLFLHAHRETTRFFEIFDDVHAQPHTSRFTYRRAAFFNTLKSKTGLMVARAAALRTNINIDGRPLPTQKRRRTSSKHCAPHVLHASAPHFHLPVN
jgi:hypothetical protein